MSPAALNNLSTAVEVDGGVRYLQESAISANQICRLNREKSGKILFASHTYLNPDVGCRDSRPSIHDDPHCGRVISNQLVEHLNPSMVSTLEKKIVNFRSWTRFHLLNLVSIPFRCVDLKLW